MACGLLVACQRDEPASAPRPPPTLASAARSVELASAAPAASTASTASPPAAPPEPRGDPATLWVPALFRVGAVARFRVTDSVDPHAPAGGRVETRGEVELVVCEVTWSDGGARAVARGSFVDRPGAGEVAALLPAVRVEGTASELVVLLDPPRTLRRPSAGRGRAGVGCVEERDPGPYGPSTARLCFDEAGLTSMRLENRAGPRLTLATRVGPPALDPKRCDDARAP